MSLTEYSFQYDASRLELFHYTLSLSDPIIPGVIIVVILATLIAYRALPYLYGYLRVQEMDRDKAEKRRVIQDLILMKEIQGELEREMEQALLNMALQDRSQHA